MDNFDFQSINDNNSIFCNEHIIDFNFNEKNHLFLNDYFLESEDCNLSEFSRFGEITQINNITSENTNLKNQKVQSIKDYSIKPLFEVKQIEQIFEPKENIIFLKEEENLDQVEIILQKRDKNLPPIQYDYNKIIKEIFPKIKNNAFIEDFKQTPKLLVLEKKMSDDTFNAPKRRNRNKVPELNDGTKKLGRKKKNDNKERLHNKSSEDNIIKKIKSKLWSYLIEFINNMLDLYLKDEKIISLIKIMKNIKGDKNPEKETLIKELDYKMTIDETKKENNLQYLKMSIKDFLSQDISPKFKTYSTDSNKKIIEIILNNEKDKDNSLIVFIFNLTVGNWFDIFTYKKELTDFIKLNRDDFNKIMEKFIRADKLLDEIYKKLKKNNYNDKEKNYFSFFISILYNFERWFFIKQKRKRGEKK